MTPAVRTGRQGYQQGDYNPWISQGRSQEEIWRGMGNRGYEDNENWQAEFGDTADQYGDLEGGATGNVNDLYNPIWQGGGGYTPEQLQNVLQSQGLQDIQGQLPDNHLKDWERQQIAGDPGSALRMFSTQAPGIMNLAADWAGNMQGGVNAGRTIGDAAINRMQEGYDRAIDPSKLGLSTGYRPGLNASLAQGRSDVMQAQGDPGLGVTDEYLRQAGMSDQEVQNLATSAGRSVGAQFGATKDQLLQNAAAAGTATPMGVASAMGAMDRASAAERVDAENRARLGARQAQRDAAQGVQNTQLSAGQYRAGLGSSNALALQGRDLDTQQNAEQLRLGAEQGLADRRTQAVGDVGNAALAHNTAMTNTGLSAANSSANLGMNAAQYNATNATNLAGDSEQQQSDRAAQLAFNRQGVNQGNQQTQLGVNNALAGRYQAGYQPWVNAQTEGRQAATGQQEYFGNQQNQQNNFRLQGQGQANDYLLNAQQGYSGIRQDNKNNSFGSKLKGAVASGVGSLIGGLGGPQGNFTRHARGGIVDQYQISELGEGDRPEMILPLDPATPPDQRNQFEQVGSQLGEAMGIPRRRPQMNSYGQNMGRHNRPTPMPYSEMGTIAYA